MAAEMTPEIPDELLAERIAGLLSYRPGMSTFPPERHAVEVELHILPLWARRYLATGAWNLHRKIEALQQEAAAARVSALRESEKSMEALREAVIAETRKSEEARAKAFEDASKLCDELAENERRSCNSPCGDFVFEIAAEKIRARAKEAPSSGA